MHKSFYASGFLYHQSSQKILLQQIPSLQNLLSQWYLFGESYREGADPKTIFKNIIYEQLGIKIDKINSVYSYERGNTNQTIFYSEIDNMYDFPAKNERVFNWFAFKNIPKLHIIEQTKHDIVVSQRVIEAVRRANDPSEHKSAEMA